LRSIAYAEGSTDTSKFPIIVRMAQKRNKRRTKGHSRSERTTESRSERTTEAQSRAARGKAKQGPSDTEVLQESGRFRVQGYEKPDGGGSKRTNRGSKRTNRRVTQKGFIERLGELVSADDIIEAGRRLGALKRQRKVDLPALVQATVAAMSPIPGAETSALVNYLSITGVPLVPSSFYDRFSPEFAALMQELAGRAVQMVREVSPDDRGIHDYGVLLDRFDDVQAADGCCAILKCLASRWAPSTSKKRPAGYKINAVISLRDHLPTAIDVTAQRRHDNAALPEDVLRPNTLTFFDLGYIDTERFVDMTLRGAFFLTRLKTNHNPIIHRVRTGRGRRLEARGLRLDEALDSGVLDFDRGLIDIDVVLESGGRKATVRVAGIEDEEGDRWWYLTNVGREILGPSDVGQAYRLRWDIELLFKQLKSGAGLKAVLAWRSSAVLAFLYAKIVALCLARLLELSVEEQHGPHATTQLALLLTLSRSMPLLLGVFMQQRGVTLAEFEQRIIMIASIVARSRRQRRERAKRKRRQALGGSNR